MRVCVVGSGGREHALARVLARTSDVVVAGGNPGIEGSVADAPEEIDADLFVIGPEAPLVDGLADRLRARGALVFGPGADGARLEGSKAWMKDLFVAAGIPTARHGTFTEERPALAFLDTMAPPFVVKTDGLAAGKGVVVTDSRTEAGHAVGDYLSGVAFGESGKRLIIEEGLVGPEVSVFAVCDGRRGVLLPPAQDHKRIGDGDTGPNTGGMGAYSPVPVVSTELLARIQSECIQPTLDELRRRDIEYRGVLFAGLMLTADGPKMLEYNVRFGDPECQTIIPLITSDLAELLASAARGSLGDPPTFSTEAAVTVVLAAEGYPAAPRTGDVIRGIENAEALDGVSVFCAGVRRGPEEQLVTAGGRVLNVTAVGVDLAQARERAYAAAALISWPGMTMRTDIGAVAAR